MSGSQHWVLHHVKLLAEDMHFFTNADISLLRDVLVDHELRLSICLSGVGDRQRDR